uniref:Uncharacterized protein n=1 Tax=mine drainage metagenome TaxID=410659 RepID=E6PDA0_9ZZZZ
MPSVIGSVRPFELPRSASGSLGAARPRDRVRRSQARSRTFWIQGFARTTRSLFAALEANAAPRSISKRSISGRCLPASFLQHTTLLHALHDNRKGRTLSPGLTRLELEFFRIGFSVRLGDRPDSRALAFGWGLASRTRRSG